MQTKILTVTEDSFAGAVRAAGNVIRAGGLVAFPTETVYGLGADAFSKDAAKRIYAAKGRPSDNPLIVHIAETEELYKIAEAVPEVALKLADAFWPGPLTMILPRGETIPKETTGGRDTVAVRLPSNAIAREMIRRSGTAVAAPSANVSGRPSPTEARHVVSDLDGKIDMILDGGSVGIGVESTIIDLTTEAPRILRPGFVTRHQLSAVAGTEVTDSYGDGTEEDTEALAPGMKYRHYAPNGTLTIVSGAAGAVHDYIETALRVAKEQGKRTGVLCPDAARFHADAVIDIGARADAAAQAKALYRALRTFDEKEIDVIYAEALPEGGEGAAVMNRLRKAAGGRVITVSSEKERHTYG